MTDLIVGMGDVGSTLYRLFESKKIKCSGFDLVKSKCRNWPIGKVDILHITIPYSFDFKDGVLSWIETVEPDYVIIHSTIPIGTTKKIQDETDTLVIYSPVRGRHDTFLEDIMFYEKFYSYFGNPDINVRNIMAQRFDSFRKGESPTSLELSKIMCDTTYFGLLIAYRKFVDKMAQDNGVIDHDLVWEFTKQIHEKHGNRPILYNDNKPIGGHCVLENLDLLNENEVSKFIKKYGGTNG